MKAVAETLEVRRSNLILRQNGSGKPRRAYTKAEDAFLLPAIRAIVDQRPGNARHHHAMNLASTTAKQLVSWPP